MSHAAEPFVRGAEMARQIAADYRRDAEKPGTPESLKHKWLVEAERADERAAWYSDHARMMQ